MKVVLFCGGFGMRIREYSEAIPKPMVPIGYRPILWHLMKYYSHFGHREFVLCLGWKADVIKDYFLKYNECESNDFVLSLGDSSVELLGKDIDDWRITFVDTGATANVGERLKAIQPYVGNDETFLANYADGLADCNLPTLLDFHRERRAVCTFLSVRPTHSFHRVDVESDGTVMDISDLRSGNLWMNAGFFVLNREVFDYLEDGEEFVEEPFRRLIANRKLASMKHDGFYACMDTFKERQDLDDMHARGETPWQVWKCGASPYLAEPPNVESTLTTSPSQS